MVEGEANRHRSPYIFLSNSRTNDTKQLSGVIMKKYILMGLIAGTALSALVLYLRRKKLAGTEFREIFDSSLADDIFGDAFEELPDKP